MYIRLGVEKLMTEQCGKISTIDLDLLHGYMRLHYTGLRLLFLRFLGLDLGLIDIVCLMISTAA